MQEDFIKNDENRNDISYTYVLSKARTLALALQQIGSAAPVPDPEISIPIYNWLQKFKGQLEIGEKTEQLQNEKVELVDIMKDANQQLLEQTTTLQKQLNEKSEILKSTENMLQKEVLLRSLLETQKLELITAISEIKLQNAALNKELYDIKHIRGNDNNISLESEKKSKFAILNGEICESEEYVQKLNLLKHSSHNFPQNFNSLPRSALSTSNKTHSTCNVGRVYPTKDFECEKDFITPEKKNSKGLKVFFDKICRSECKSLQNQLSETAFIRGGMRATASPRLGWDNPSESPKEFTKWNIDDVCVWLHEIGLGCYENEARRWLIDGVKVLIDSSPVDIEKELKLKSSLHRKKIVLAVAALTGKEKDELFLKAGKLSNAWVMRWLDDVGLPQLKEFFANSKIDGRMLHKLTMEDLSPINLHSYLHIASLRYGIQVMREYKWDPDCLIRRSTNDTMENNNVELWTAHRVMEWLRAVDLAEYAPNLRGAGVHGALMKYEPKFNAQLLADLLCIPQSKTLLRRHLEMHFKNLLGRDIIQSKRDAENLLGYEPLTITSKIKISKKSQFSLKRRKSTKGVQEWSDYVCPTNPNLANKSASNVSHDSTKISASNADEESICGKGSCQRQSGFCSI